MVERLIDKDYLTLERDGRAGRVGAAGLERAVGWYGKRLAKLPDEAFDISEAYEVSSQPGVWFVEMTLWTAEEGRSDLTLSLKITEIGRDIAVEIEDLHVL